jgi:hypothetical protein
LAIGQGLTPTGFELNLTSHGGFTYRVEASLDLREWITITTLQVVEGERQILDPAALDAGHRFYRAVME